MRSSRRQLLGTTLAAAALQACSLRAPRLPNLRTDLDYLPGLTNYEVSEALKTLPRDPTRLAFGTPGVSSKDINYSALSPLAIYDMAPADDTVSYILKKAKEHREKIGPLKELVIEAHGNPSQMNPRQDQFLGLGRDHLIYVSELLLRMANPPFSILNLTSRLVFASCYLFADLSPARVAFYRDMTRLLKADIAGSVSIVEGRIGRNAGNYVAFKPDGSIDYDVLWAGAPEYGKFSDKWVDCYAGKNAAQGDRSYASLNLETRLRALRYDLRDPHFPEPYANRSVSQLLDLLQHSSGRRLSKVQRITVLRDAVEKASLLPGLDLSNLAFDVYFKEALSWSSTEDRIENLLDIANYVRPNSSQSERLVGAFDSLNISDVELNKRVGMAQQRLKAITVTPQNVHTRWSFTP